MKSFDEFIANSKDNYAINKDNYDSFDAESYINSSLNPIGRSLSLMNHYIHFPYHPWNKWVLDERKDDKNYVRGNYNGYYESYIWRNYSGESHRISAPAFIGFNENAEIEAEGWIINEIYHRLDGPALRDGRMNTWFLFDCRLTEDQHKEIISLYDELGDWELSFSLSSFINYNGEFLPENIRKIIDFKN